MNTPFWEKVDTGIDRLLRAEEVAVLLNVSLSYAYRLMQSGQIATVRIGRSVRVRQQGLEAFINRNTFRPGDLDLID